MAYFIIIRGPAASGKTTIAKMLSKKLNGRRISIDDLLRKNKLDKIEGECIPLKNFIKASDIVIPDALKNLKKSVVIIFDGNFYHRSQINDIIKRVKYPHFVFTLKADVVECVKRDKKRKGIGKKSVEDVHKLVSKFNVGYIIDTTNKTKSEVMREIIEKIQNTKENSKPLNT
jgi:adenylate kinase family enzyme